MPEKGTDTTRMIAKAKAPRMIGPNGALINNRSVYSGESEVASDGGLL
jgi:hypothetical protein